MDDLARCRQLVLDIAAHLRQEPFCQGELASHLQSKAESSGFVFRRFLKGGAIWGGMGSVIDYSGATQELDSLLCSLGEIQIENGWAGRKVVGWVSDFHTGKFGPYKKKTGWRW